MRVPNIPFDEHSVALTEAPMTEFVCYKPVNPWNVHHSVATETVSASAPPLLPPVPKSQMVALFNHVSATTASVILNSPAPTLPTVPQPPGPWDVPVYTHPYHRPIPSRVQGFHHGHLQGLGTAAGAQQQVSHTSAAAATQVHYSSSSAQNSQLRLSSHRVLFPYRPWSRARYSTLPTEAVPRPLKDKERIFSPAELWGRYEFVRYLGRGAYGHVCEAKDKKTGTRVAIKKITNVFENRQEAKRILRECRILRELKNCAYISDVVEVLPPLDFNNFKDLLIVFEFVDTDLSKIIEHTDQYFTVRHVQYFLWQLLLGLKFIHSAHIVHRDLKPANVLINENCSLKICDFGLSRGLDSHQHHRSPSGGEHLSAAVLTPAPKKRSNATQQLSNAAPKQETSSSGGTGSGPNTLSAGTANLKNGKGRRKNSFIAEEVQAQSIQKALQQEAAGGDDDTHSQLDNDVIPRRPTMDRTLTRHVVTRYYRAPEVLLSAKYSTGVDIWAVGCILGDLLGMQRENNPNRMDRASLFPGTYSSFSPLNPDIMRRDPENAASHMDQLKVVFNVIGTPTREEIEALECHPNTKAYLLRLPQIKKLDFQKKYPARGSAACYCWQRRTASNEPWSYFSQLSNEELTRLYKTHQSDLSKQREAVENGAAEMPVVGPTSVRYNQSVWEVDFERNTLSSPDYPTYHIRRVNAGLDLLDRLLQFDVTKRLTVDQALEHPFLRLYHNQDMIDKVEHEAVTFEFEDIELTRPKIRELILKEVLHYSPECKTQMESFLGHAASGDAGHKA